MKICCVSDLHGYLPEIPDCDLLLLAGDYSPHPKTELFWLGKYFAPWIAELSQRMKIIGIAGNHDILFERYPDLVPQMKWEYLKDSGTEFGGLKIYGTPWQLRFYDWAFNASEEELSRIWAKIPDDTDIFLLHGPPLGYGDFVPDDNKYVGSPSLLKRIEEIKPKLVVYGHIHAGYGQYSIDNTILVNVAHCDEKYRPVNPPIVVEI